MLKAAGVDNLTPFAFQADIMNGTDPSAQDVAVERSLFTQHKVKAFLCSLQVTDTLTRSFHLFSTCEMASRWSASTRPCRSPATTTSRGCFPPKSKTCKGRGQWESSTRAPVMALSL